MTKNPQKSKARSSIVERIASVAIAAAMLGIFSTASIAQADVADRSLPAGDQLYLLPCGNDIRPALYTVDLNSGALTPIGADLSVASCWSSGYYNPTDGLIYAVNWDVQAPSGKYYFSSINTQTGAVQNLVEISSPGDTFLDQYSVAMSPAGVIYVTDATQMFTMDPATGDTTLIGTLQESGGTAHSEFYTFAFDPISGDLYGNSWNDGGDTWYTIDTGTAVLTPEPTFNAGNQNAGLAFDSTGVAWFQYENNFAGSPGFASGTFPDLAATRGNAYPFNLPGDVSLYGESLIVAPIPSAEPSLPDTGVSTSSTVPWAIGILAMGALVLVVGLRRRKS